MTSYIFFFLFSLFSFIFLDCSFFELHHIFFIFLDCSFFGGTPTFLCEVVVMEPKSLAAQKKKKHCWRLIRAKMKPRLWFELHHIFFELQHKRTNYVDKEFQKIESKKVMKQETLESNLKPNISTYGYEVHTCQCLYMVMTHWCRTTLGWLPTLKDRWARVLFLGCKERNKE